MKKDTDCDLGDLCNPFIVCFVVAFGETVNLRPMDAFSVMNNFWKITEVKGKSVIFFLCISLSPQTRENAADYLFT